MNFAHLGHPLLIPFLLAVVACAFGFTFVPRIRRLFQFGPATFYVRCVSLFLLALAFVEPYREIVHEESSAVVLLDISDSMDQAGTQALLARADNFRQAGVNLDAIPFAETAPAFSFPLESSPGFSRIQQSWGKLNIGSTNLAAGFSSLFSRSPGSVLLISDGNENSGDVRKLVSALRASDFRVFPLVPQNAQNGSAEFHLSNLSAPLIAASQKSVEVRASIQNTTDQEQRGRLQILHEKKVIHEGTVSVAPHSELLVTAQSDPSSEGIKEIVAQLTPAEPKIAPTSLNVFLSGQPRERVLLVSGAEEDEKFLKEALQSQSYEVESLLPAAKGSSLPDLSKYSVVVFNNAGYDQLARSSTGLIEGYVRGGGGFIMLGGNRSFGLGGYKDTPIEQVLPVELLPPQTVKKRLNLAVELVIDKSRSMSENDKIEYAKEAARATINALKNEDYVGVIGFDASPFEVVKLGLVADIREKAEERVGRLFPAGRTNMLPAIDEARRSLTRVTAGRKHMIILTDGKIPDEGPYYVELVKQMRLLGISVSSVLLGSDADPGMLETMAEQGGGAFYQTNDPRSLPRIFITDLKVGSGEQTMKEEQYVVRPGTGELRSTDITAFPPIRGYVETKAKKDADLELVAFGGDKAEPLLASWKFGKGKSIAFTSDANGRWSSGWVPWPKFYKFWSDLVDSVRQPDLDARNTKFDLRYQLEHGALTLDLSVYSEKAPSSLKGELELPDGTKTDVPFAAISPGHYRGTIESVHAGKYVFQGLVDEKKLTPVAFALPGDLFGERKGEPFNLPLLYELAEGTKGKINPDLKDIKSQVYKHVERQDLTNLFIVAALILFCIEVLLREVPRVRGFRSRITA